MDASILIIGAEVVPKKLNKNLNNFGKRLADLRKSAGYTQLELANEVGISRRMIAYYEGQTKHPPTTLLPDLAKALGVTSDELLGIKPIKKPSSKIGSNRLQRKIQQIEKLGTKDKRQVLQLIDAFIEREQLKKKAGA